MDQLLQDVRVAARSLIRTPGFTAVALVTLALGLGANIAVFSVVNGVLLRPLPYAAPDRLVRLYQANPKQGLRQSRFSLADFEDWRAGTPIFSSMAAYDRVPQILTGQGDPLEVQLAYVTGGFFDVFGSPAQLGRVLAETDYRQKSRHAVISDRLWRTEFAAGPSLIGRSIMLRGEAFTVVGVMAPSFRYPTADTDVWAPESVLNADALGPHVRDNRIFEGVARLTSGVSPERAQADLSAVSARLAAEHSRTNDQWSAATVTPLRTAIVGDVDHALVVVSIVVGVILLIGCVNLANLLLARGASRANEIAIRTALGARRLRIVRQLVTEHLVLALVGGVLGLALAVASLTIVLALGADTLPRLEDVHIDGRVIGASFLLSCLTGLVFSVLPTMRATSVEPQRSLKSGRGTVGGGRRLRNALVVAEIALALVLLVGAVLMARSFLHLGHVDPGFNPGQVLTVTMQMNVEAAPASGVAAQLVQRQRDVITRIAALPGVVAVGLTHSLPLRDERNVFEYTRTGGTSQDRSRLRLQGTSGPCGFRSCAASYSLIRGRLRAGPRQALRNKESSGPCSSARAPRVASGQARTRSVRSWTPDGRKRS